MVRAMLFLADVGLTLAHLAVIAVNLTGWTIPALRGITLWVQGFTVASWVGLGVLRGWGYCPLTDWHWQVKRALGESDLPSDFVTYLLVRVAGLPVDETFVQGLILGSFAIAVVAAVHAELTAHE